MNEPAHVRYAPGTPYGNRWPRCHEVPEGIAFAQEMVAAAANPFDAHPASECREAGVFYCRVAWALRSRTPGRHYPSN